MKHEESQSKATAASKKHVRIREKVRKRINKAKCGGDIWRGTCTGGKKYEER